MKTLRAYILAALFLFSLILIKGCNRTDSPTAAEEPSISGTISFEKGSGPSAGGQGRISGTDRTFAFSAVTHKDGSVSGQGQLNNRAAGVKIHFSIDCISVSGNAATMSGTVTNSNFYVPGGPCWFKVKDNGEGVNAPPDEITGFLFCEPDDPDPLCNQLTCDVNNESDAGGLNPIESGNIQVKP